MLCMCQLARTNIKYVGLNEVINTVLGFRKLQFLKIHFHKIYVVPVCLLFSAYRFHIHLWWDIKRKEWDHWKPWFSIRLPKRGKLYMGYCSRGRQPNSDSLSVFCSGGGIWFFIPLWWTSSSSQLQDKVSTAHGVKAECSSFFLNVSLMTLDTIDTSWGPI